jgi:ATP-dependent Lon protease
MSVQPSPDFNSSFPLLPLRGAVLFPGATVPFGVGRPKTLALVEHMVKHGLAYVALFAQRDVSVEEPTASDLHEYGTLARVVAVEKERNGTYAVVVEGIARIQLRSVEQTTPYLEARVEPIEVKEASNDDELEALGLSLREATGKLIELLPVRRDAAARVAAIQSPGELADTVAAFLEITIEDSVALLGLGDLKARIRRILVHLSHRTEVLRMRNKINSQVK